MTDLIANEGVLPHTKIKKSYINIRIDSDIKRHLQKVQSSNGLSISQAIRIYLWQIATQGGIPFKGLVPANLP